MLEQNYSSLFQLYIIGISSTLIIAGMTFLLSIRKESSLRLCKNIFYFSLFVYLFYTFAFQFLKLYTYKYYADFAVWLELFSNIIDGRGLISTLHQTSLGFGDTKNYLALHFVPLIYILVLPLYIVKNYPAYLIVIQTLILSSSVIPIYLFARDIFNNKKIGYLFAASFLWFPTIQYINLYDFEFLRICIPLLLFSFYFIYKKKIVLYYLFFVLSILVREEVSITTFLLGIYVFFILKERKAGIITSIGSILYFFVVTKILMPYFAGDSRSLHLHVAFGNFSYMGDTPSQILMYIVSHPLIIISNLIDKIKIANFLMYALPLLFSSFFSPSIFFIATANLLLNFLSKSISHYSYILYYLSPTIPFLFLSAIKGGKNISKWGEAFLENRNFFSWKCNNNSFSHALACSIFAGCVSSNIFFGPSPVSIQFWNSNYKLAPYKTHNFHYSQYIRRDHHRKAFSFLPLIPDNAAVSAEHFFLPYLYKKRTLMIFPIFEGAEYVLIDKTHPVKFGTIDVDPVEARKDPQKYYDLVEKDTEKWELVKEDDGIFLYKRRHWSL